MNEKDIRKILASGETPTLEFKEHVNAALCKTISAFANTNGGMIVLGANKKGKITGVEPTTKYLEDLVHRIINKLTLYPDLSTLEIDGKRVLIIRITRSNFPVSYEGGYYERVGTATREMNPQRLRSFLLSSTPWDSVTNDFQLDEIDTETVDLFVHAAVKSNRLPELTLNQPSKRILEQLGLIADDKLTNGAVLLFGKNPQRYFANHCVRIGRFKTETTIVDDKWVKGNLFQQFDQTLNILKQYIGVRYDITAIQRQDIWEYPIPAVRESVLNALIHRNYFEVASFIQIKVYDDHIWVSNHGKLPEGISVEDLTKPHKSYPRNPLIAKIFYLAGYIEQFGSGTLRILEWMRNSGLPDPKYKEEMGGFSVYLHKDVYTDENFIKLGLNERQIAAIDYVKRKEKITNKEYQELCDTSERTATRDLSDLVARQVFVQVGITGKGTNYILKPPQSRQSRHPGATKRPKRSLT